MTIITCRYCGADYDRTVVIDIDEHAADCPHVTGLFPVDERGPTRCMVCQAFFGPDDFYVKRAMTEEEAEASPYASFLGAAALADPSTTCSVCVGCGVPSSEAA